MQHSKQSKHIGRLFVVLLGAIPGSWGALAAADMWMPFVSQVRRTVTEVSEDRPNRITETWDGIHLRRTDGSELRKLELVRPTPPEPVLEGSFIDRPNKKAYRLLFPVRTARMIQNNLPGRVDASRSREGLVGQGRQMEVVEGVPCFVVPVPAAAFGGDTFSGRGCYSPEYDLHLYQVLDRTQVSGLIIRERTELYNLELGRAPEVDAVKIPDNFVARDDLCASCERNP